jgi:hypothetical protein
VCDSVWFCVVALWGARSSVWAVVLAQYAVVATRTLYYSSSNVYMCAEGHCDWRYSMR